MIFIVTVKTIGCSVFIMFFMQTNRIMFELSLLYDLKFIDYYQITLFHNVDVSICNLVKSGLFNVLIKKRTKMK
jgi:hypothetical protein